MDWIPILTAVVAAYGAGLATYTFVLKRKDNSRKIRVKPSFGFLTTANGLSEHMLCLEAMNPGNRSVIVNVPYLLIPGGKSLIFQKPLTNVTFPFELQEGRNCTVWIPIDNVTSTLSGAGYTGTVKLIACYPNQIGTIYKSKKFSIDLDTI